MSDRARRRHTVDDVMTVMRLVRLTGNARETADRSQGIIRSRFPNSLRFMPMYPICSAILMTVFASQPQVPLKVLTSAEEAQILRLLRSIDEGATERKQLEKLGAFTIAAVPLYKRVLDDPKAEPWDVANVLGAIAEMKDGRHLFLDRVVAKLAHENRLVHWVAVDVLSVVGTARDCGPVVALLSDEHYAVAITAARTLSRLGGERELVAMNAWLRVSDAKNHSVESRANYETIRKSVVKHRDELKARLDKANKAEKPR